MEFNILLLPGDGIGPEVIDATVQVLDFVAARGGHKLRYTRELIGGCSIDRHGVALTGEVLTAARSSDAVLLGAVGGPKWDDPLGTVRPEQGILGLRRGLEVYTNIRPVKAYPALADVSPLKAERLVGVDMVVLRELTGGLYFGEKRREVVNGREQAVDTLVYNEDEIRRIVHFAFRLARTRRKHVTSVDKANIIETSRLWRRVASQVAAEYPDVAIEHVLVDTAAMRLIARPASFDVVVTENMFGDILTDEAAVLAGSMGMLPSASLGDAVRGLYEPVHGTAPDIAGKGIANPIGAILSGALMLRHSLGLEAEAALIENAVENVINAGCRPPDLGGRLTTDEMTAAVLAACLNR
jgi:3-isopropylmalate dehydrogenase